MACSFYLFLFLLLVFTHLCQWKNKRRNKNKSKKMSKAYYIAHSLNGHDYFYHRIHGVAHRISQHEYEIHTLDKHAYAHPSEEGFPKKWVVGTTNALGEKKFVYMTRKGRDKKSYEVTAASFFDPTSHDDKDTLHEISDVIAQHHVNVTMPDIGQKLLYTPSKMAIVKVPSIPLRGVFVIPTSSTGANTCIGEAELSNARAHQDEGENKTPSALLTGEDTYQACLSGSCKYALTVINATREEYEDLKSASSQCVGLFPPVAKVWYCAKGDDNHPARAFFLRHMMNTNLETALDESKTADKDAIKAKLKDMVNDAHKKLVTLGPMSTKSIVVKGSLDKENGYQLFFTDMSGLRCHNGANEKKTQVGMSVPGSAGSTPQDTTFTNAVVADNAALTTLLASF
jgi:hypothetical protein